MAARDATCIWSQPRPNIKDERTCNAFLRNSESSSLTYVRIFWRQSSGREKSPRKVLKMMYHWLGLGQQDGRLSSCPKIKWSQLRPKNKGPKEMQCVSTICWVQFLTYSRIFWKWSSGRKRPRKLLKMMYQELGLEQPNWMLSSCPNLKWSQPRPNIKDQRRCNAPRRNIQSRPPTYTKIAWKRSSRRRV